MKKDKKIQKIVALVAAILVLGVTLATPISAAVPTTGPSMVNFLNLAAFAAEDVTCAGMIGYNGNYPSETVYPTLDIDVATGTMTITLPESLTLTNITSIALYFYNVENYMPHFTSGLRYYWVAYSAQIKTMKASFAGLNTPDVGAAVQTVPNVPMLNISNIDYSITSRIIQLQGLAIYQERAFTTGNFAPTFYVPYNEAYWQDTGSGDTDAAYQNGYNAGQTAGYNSGYADGENAGYDEGYTDGEIIGKETGYQNGYADGEDAGYDRGHDEGYQAGLDENGSINPDIYQLGIFANATFVFTAIYQGANGIEQYAIYDVEISKATNYIYFSESEIQDIIHELEEQGITEISSFGIAVTTPKTVAFQSEFIFYIGTTETLPYGHVAHAETGKVYNLKTEYTPSVNGYRFIVDTTGIISTNITTKDMFFGINTTFDRAYQEIERNLTQFKLMNYSGIYQVGFDEGFEAASREVYRDAWEKGKEYGIEEGKEQGRLQGIKETTEKIKNGTFNDLITTVIETPANVFAKMFDFNILGVNMKVFIGSLAGLCVLIIIIKFIIKIT